MDTCTTSNYMKLLPSVPGIVMEPCEATQKTQCDPTPLSITEIYTCIIVENEGKLLTQTHSINL